MAWVRGLPPLVAGVLIVAAAMLAAAPASTRAAELEWVRMADIREPVMVGAPMYKE